MKLFVVFLALFSERFLVYLVAHQRLYWINRYINIVLRRCSSLPAYSQFLILLILPGILMQLILISFAGLIFGLVGFFIHLSIFYYCIGPINPFYPPMQAGYSSAQQVANYLIDVNQQVFALIFWYLILGLPAVITYRLITICVEIPIFKANAKILLQYLDYIPARLTGFAYLLVGNFQEGFTEFKQKEFWFLKNNNYVLQECGLKALYHPAEKKMFLLDAEHLVEHALILILVVISLGSLVAWI